MAVRLMRLAPAVLALAALAACNPAGPPPTEAEMAAPRALFDVDQAATADFKADLVARYGEAADGAEAETGLTADGFACSPDPTNQRETACVRETARDGCTEARIVRTRPWRPTEAQVIVICEPGGAKK